MNELRGLNAAMRYIEAHLAEEIDPKALSRVSGCPAGLFGRVFSVLCGMPLGEYIRLRRLSLAAMALKNGQERVIDLAFKYGYESEDAFAAAFKRYHGITPGAVRREGSFSFLAPIHFSIKVEGGYHMNIRIEERAPFTVAGYSLGAEGAGNFSGLWEKLEKEKGMALMTSLGSGQSYGLCYDSKEDGSFSYMAAFDCADEDRAKGLDLDIMHVPQAKYAVVTVVGPIPKSIHDGWAYIWGTYLPAQGLSHAGTPDFEYYFGGDMQAEDYKMEIWVPVIKAE